MNLDSKSIIAQYGKGASDTGSSEVQIALITTRITQLTGHFAKHVKDHHGRRGLLKLVGKRRRLLSYLQRTNIASYRKVIESLNLRK